MYIELVVMEYKKEEFFRLLLKVIVCGDWLVDDLVVDSVAFEFDDTVNFGSSVIAFTEFLAIARITVDGTIEVFDIVVELEGVRSALAEEFTSARDERVFRIGYVETTSSFTNGSVCFDVFHPEESVVVGVDGVVNLGAFEVFHCDFSFS